MFNPYAMSFHEGLYKTHGRVARVYGFFGVRLLTEPGDNIHCEQDIQLVVSDPKACNHIFIKDIAIFEPTEAFLRFVLLLE